MSDSNFSATDDSRPLPGAEMSFKPLGVDVTPGDPCREHATFSLCQIPYSLTDRLVTACQWFWRRNRRCIGIVLLLDPAERAWSAVIPAQRSSADSACWSGARRDVPGADPGSVLAGSFQSRVLSPGDDPADCPPPHDGLHLVLVIGDQTSELTAYLRCDGVTRRVPPQDVVFDDVEPMFLAAAGRIVLT